MPVPVGQNNAPLTEDPQPKKKQKSASGPESTARPVSLHLIFFSSRLADVALRLGPYMRVSSKNIVQGHKSLKSADRLKQTTKNTTTQKATTRKSPSQICVSPAETRQKQNSTKTHQKRGQSPNKNTHRIDQLSDAAASTASQPKTCKLRKRIIAAVQA